MVAEAVDLAQYLEDFQQETLAGQAEEIPVIIILILQAAQLDKAIMVV
jgi:hypothetical protein